MHINFKKRWFNDYILNLINSDARYEIVWGGAGSGKSHGVAQLLIYKCLKEPYFRCVHSRKTKEDIQDSTFKMLIDVIEGAGLGGLFKANKNEKDITCKLNGNSFLSFGMNDPSRIKSIANPTDIWMEEMTEFTQEDFDMFDMRLRTKRAKDLKIWGLFNPVNESHWIKTNLLDQNIPELNSTHTTYLDNRFIDHAQYKKTFDRIREYDPVLADVYEKGIWGVEDKNKYFCKNFLRQKHVVEGIDWKELYDPNLEVVLSWDFNITNTCLVYQYTDDYVYQLKEYHEEGTDIQDVCQMVKNDFPNDIFVINGDASGGNRSAVTRGGKSAFTIIKNLLDLTWDNFNVPKRNPGLSSSRMLTNMIFKEEPAYLIHHECKKTIEDNEQVKWINQKIDKSNELLTHCLDAERYFHWAQLRTRIEDYNLQFLEEKELL